MSTGTSRLSLVLLVSLAMLAFAGNSLLTRLALDSSEISAANFTLIRLFSGALLLLPLALIQNKKPIASIKMSLALFIYAAGFSYAYINLSAASGALILFACVQLTMMAVALCKGERFSLQQTAGVSVAFAGLVYLLLPGLNAPPLSSATLMAVAGVAWGAYSIWGKSAGAPMSVTAGNFLLALVPALILAGFYFDPHHWTPITLFYAIASGAITSGLGYALWYRVLPHIKTSQAASVQLSVPVITAILAVLFIAEPLTLRIIIASVAILGGIYLVIRVR